MDGTYATSIMSTYAGFSIADVYKFHCEKMRLREISGVSKCLPRKQDDFGLVAELDLSCMHLGDIGCYGVLEAVRVCWNCVVLRLAGCGLTNDVARLVAQVGMTHPTLRTLDVSDNPFLSAPAGEQLLLMARRNPNVTRIVLNGKVNIPADLVKKLRKQLDANQRARFEEMQPGEKRAFLFEAAIDEVLTPDEKLRLHKPMRTLPLAASLLHTATPPILVTDDPWRLPQLTRDEHDRARRAFRVEDENSSGYLTYQMVIQALRNFGLKDSDRDDAYLINLFERINRSDDGFLMEVEWLIFLRNVLSYEGYTYKSDYIAKLRASYNSVEADSGGIETCVLHVSTCLSHLSNLLGEPLPDVIEEKVPALLIAASGMAAEDEYMMPMPFESYAEATLVAHCIVNKHLASAAIRGKLLVEPPKGRL
ncbi:putative serine/threonine-protein kinase roco5 [Diplonema papillatum]|nr:putative serine/threonine-protein kinase roco5 [Diplonema papillatum]|eukprot:gene5862-8975_t